MTWNRLFAFRLAAIATLGTVTPVAAQQLPLISANDNRVASGTLQDGVLTLRLEMRKGIWHPESENGEAIPVYAFGEAGKPHVRLSFACSTKQIDEGCRRIDAWLRQLR